MSALDKETVEKIASLARLAIDKDDIESYAKQLSGILDLVEQMNAVDTKDILLMAHPQDQKQRLREDQVSESDQHQAFQKIAPKVEAGLYLVPKVIE